MSENKKPMFCAIYSRVSTTEQNIENQVKLLKKVAFEQNCKVFKVYRDKMSGGSANRPQFQQMLRDARLRKFETIYVWSLDRFSREGIKNTLSYLKQLQSQGVALKSMQESWLDTSDDGMGTLLIAIFSWVAEQDRKRISERTKAGFYVDKEGITRSVKHNKAVGKRGPDKKLRDNLGYKLRWSKKRVSK